MDAEQREMLLEFVAESLETLDLVEPLIIDLGLDLEADRKSESVSTIFRLFHSLKGGAGFLNFNTIKRLTHTAETLLQLFRKETIEFDSDCVDILVRCGDLIRQMLEKVGTVFEDTGFESESAILVGKLEEIIQRISKSEVAPEQETSPSQNLPHAESEKNNTPLTETEIPVESATVPNKEETDFAAFLLTPEMTQSFVQEAEEQLEATEEALLVLEKIRDENENIPFIETAFRQIHTLKGNSGFLGLVSIEQLSHKTESVLGELKDRALEVNDQLIQTLLKVVDTLRVGIKTVAENQQLQMPDADFVLSQLTAILERKTIPVSPTEDEFEIPDLASEAVQRESQFSIDLDPLPDLASEAVQKESEPPLELDLNSFPDSETLPPLETNATAPQITHSNKETKKINGSEEDELLRSKENGQKLPQSKTSLKQSDIRVNVNKIDQLINLVGELVISEAMITHNPNLTDIESDRFVESARQLNKNVRDLQEVAMSMRMLPVSGTFRKMVRVVHDVSKKVGKKVELKLKGEDTEVDRTVIEHISDPLLHIIRNAVDHGIDSPDERTAAGKPEKGTLVLEAKHSGNEVWITISDDGRGLNREKILNRAKERGLVAEDSDPPDSEIWKMVFLPGFSTAETVTDFSGRGVGMDVVKRNIDELRGRVDVTSSPGVGTNFVLRIPLTLAIIDGMLIRVGTMIYVIPIVGIRESLKPKKEAISATNDGLEVVLIREELIPVIRLHELHQLKPDSKDLNDGIVIVIEDHENQACLFVDEVLGERQVVVKGMPQFFGDVPHLAGCTILGDGDISLILDLVSLIETV
ncbi:MAG: chemotaxis protein CheA [SAR324 cluster bacterium]|nr:chemotaxis protein CheA [SAR324 cluster bacterium]